MSGSMDLEMVEVGPVVGTQILDPNLPSNLDFDEKEQGASQVKAISNQPNHNGVVAPLGKIDADNIDIKSYSVTGKVLFNMQPLATGTIIKGNIASVSVKCFNDDHSLGLKGYVNRQMYIQQGFIYLLKQQKQSYLVVNHMKLINLFKVFLDYQDSKVRLVIKEDGSDLLLNKDYETGEIKQLIDCLNQQINSIGLSLVG